MDKQKAKSWLKLTLLLAVCFAAAMAAVMYVVDPYLHYRVRDNEYMLEGHFVNPGLIKNYDYDSVIIGSSMAQNFDMDEFRQVLGAKPVKLCVVGMRVTDMLATYNLCREEGKAKTYYIALDVATLANQGDWFSMPDYLADDDPINDYKYLYGYEAWMRFLPVDLGLMAATRLGVTLPESATARMSIDNIGNWSRYETFGKASTLVDFMEDRVPSMTEAEQQEYYDRGMKNIKMLMDGFDLDEDQFVFFFPPYSALYWELKDEGGNMDALLEMRQWLAEQLEGRDNVRLFDFQTEDFTLDIERYCDPAHYDTDINDWMVACFGDGTGLADSASVADNTQRIKENVVAARELYPEILVQESAA